MPPYEEKPKVAIPRAREAREATKSVVLLKPKTSVPAVAGTNEEYRKRYLEEISPAGIVGDGIKFSKDGEFVRVGTDDKISGDREFRALVDQTLVGWHRFNGEGETPSREMGLLYNGYVMPKREDLGDNDQSQWEEGLDGHPADPWKHTIYLVLQAMDTDELFTFITSSPTGRRACGKLMQH